MSLLRLNRHFNYCGRANYIKLPKTDLIGRSTFQVIYDIYKIMCVHNLKEKYPDKTYYQYIKAVTVHSIHTAIVPRRVNGCIERMLKINKKYIQDVDRILTECH